MVLAGEREGDKDEPGNNELYSLWSGARLAALDNTCMSTSLAAFAHVVASRELTFRLQIHSSIHVRVGIVRDDIHRSLDVRTRMQVHRSTAQQDGHS